MLRLRKTFSTFSSAYQRKQFYTRENTAIQLAGYPVNLDSRHPGGTLPALQPRACLLQFGTESSRQFYPFVGQLLRMTANADCNRREGVAVGIHGTGFKFQFQRCWPLGTYCAHARRLHRRTRNSASRDSEYWITANRRRAAMRSIFRRLGDTRGRLDPAHGSRQIRARRDLR